MTVQSPTSVPASASRASPRSHGRTQTVAVPYFFATARPFYGFHVQFRTKQGVVDHLGDVPWASAKNCLLFSSHRAARAACG